MNFPLLPTSLKNPKFQKQLRLGEDFGYIISMGSLKIFKRPVTEEAEAETSSHTEATLDLQS